ncbi:Similar to S.cerevisiae protein SKI6 (Exosome non-catalytic core component) [Malassezia sympodialis ATCC 42132]|uniref:Ribosomal RNA-processing protein 41 n=1 Tax=Malassezia sympodialis (strain ATCC 42132) TaxID=1230383 RepID=A0A1M8A156_MALS4|nr:Similar to S.cerevisiae protein SKI6 (Exosome non-catalytic core component) [Malassezia sympodialis ATCC 42132]
MSRTELLTAGGFRMDGRKPLEFRSMELSLSPHTATGESLVPTAASATSRADGSAEVRQGLTHVYACVYGPMEPGRAARAPTVRQDRATIQVDIAVAPWGAAERRYRARGDRQLVEWANAVRSTFDPVVHTHLFPRAQIDLVVHVLQQDGGVLPAMIHACTLALMDAGIPMSDYVCAMTCGLHGETAMLDLNRKEQTSLPFATVAVLPRSGQVPLMQLDTRIHMDRFSRMVDMCVEAAGVLRDELDTAMRARSARLVEAAQHPHEAIEGSQAP